MVQKAIRLQRFGCVGTKKRSSEEGGGEDHTLVGDV